MIVGRWWRDVLVMVMVIYVVVGCVVRPWWRDVLVTVVVTDVVVQDCGLEGLGQVTGDVQGDDVASVVGVDGVVEEGIVGEGGVVGGG